MAVVLLIVAGLGLWWLLAWLDPGSATTGVLVTEAPAVERVGLALPDPVPVPGLVPIAGSLEATASGLPTLGGEGPRPLPPPVQTDAPVVVRVQDDLGTPVPGAVLMLRTRVSGSHGWSAPKTTRTAADSRGAAVWTSYPGTPFSVELWQAPEGYVQHTRTSLRLNTNENPGEPPVFVVPRRGRIVVPREGIVRADALDRLTLATPGGSRQEVGFVPFAYDDPRWLVDPGTYVLMAHWSDATGLYSSDQRVQVFPGEETVVSLVSRSGTGVLQGRITDATGRPVHGMPVQVEVVREPDLLPGMTALDHSSRRLALSDASGAWRVERLPPGEVTVTARVEDYPAAYYAAGPGRSGQQVMTAGEPDGRLQQPVEVDLKVVPGYRVVGRLEGRWREDWLAGRLDLRIARERDGLRPLEAPNQRAEDGSFVLERCRAGTYRVSIRNLRAAPPPGGEHGPPVGVVDQSWRNVLATFEVDASLSEGATVTPVVLLDP